MEMKDDVKFVVDYCDTGSTLEIQTAAGAVTIQVNCIPPAKLKELHTILSEEIAKGPRKHPFEKRQ